MAEFLDHAALVSDADQVNEHAAVSLLTAHNAKGLEFPVVFLAGMEEGLFPHSRSIGSEPAMEEERRLCYVGMTRARKRLYLTWARYRRRYGSGSPEACIRSRFVGEIPPSLCERLSTIRAHTRKKWISSEQHEVRESAEKNLFTGRTVNSVENIAQFFAERGMPVPSGLTTARPLPESRQDQQRTVRRLANRPGQKSIATAEPGLAYMPPRSPPAIFLPPAAFIRRLHRAPPALGEAARTRGACGLDQYITSPKYGRGRVLRREGDGDDAKLTVSFPEYGLKKIVEKYRDIKAEE